MSCARAPNKRILESVFERTMDLITNILDSRVTADDKCFAEIWVNSFSIE
jgi:hypothetical protein